MNDRIKLAEAMGPRYTASRTAINFDPFTDANDDYAVLEWMRSKYGSNRLGLALARLQPSRSKDLSKNYEIGDYARAALKVIK